MNGTNKRTNDQTVMSQSEAWENNSDTPDITIEINDSTTTMDNESSVTEAEEEDQTKANMTIDEFLDETETIGAELGADEDSEEMFSNLMTRAAGAGLTHLSLNWFILFQVKHGKMSILAIQISPHHFCYKRI